MKYEWENDSDMRDMMDNFEGLGHGRLRVIGLIVENLETVEACATVLDWDELSGVERADVLKDATHDLMELYNESVRHMLPTKPTMQ